MNEGGENPIKAPEITVEDKFPRYCQMDRGVQKDNFLEIDELVEQTDGFMRRFAEMAGSGVDVDTVFFLDKSARPLAYMFRKLWPLYMPDTKMPAIRHINIGGSGDRKNEPRSNPFTGDPALIRQTYGQHINGRGRLVVVDEYTHTGKALTTAKEVLTGAFPKAEIALMAAYDKVPNWYQNQDFSGVEEYTFYDYQKMAVERLNEERGTQYTSSREVEAEDLDRLGTIFEELRGTIPFVKRGRHILTTYEKESREKRETNVLRQARAELDEVCRMVAEKIDGAKK